MAVPAEIQPLLFIKESPAFISRIKAEIFFQFMRSELHFSDVPDRMIRHV